MTAKAKRLGRRLTDMEVAAAGELVQSGGGSVESVAASLGVSRRTLTRKFAEKGISAKVDAEKAKKAASAAAEATKQALIGDPLERAKHIVEARDSFRKIFTFLSRLGMKGLTDAAKAGTSPALLLNEAKTLHLYAQFFRHCEEGTFKALGMDRDGGDDGEALPTLEIRITDAEDLKRIAEMRGSLGDDLGLADVPPAALPDLTEEDDVVEGEPPAGAAPDARD